jgi:hypothetical protein
MLRIRILLFETSRDSTSCSATPQNETRANFHGCALLMPQAYRQLYYLDEPSHSSWLTRVTPVLYVPLPRPKQNHRDRQDHKDTEIPIGSHDIQELKPKPVSVVTLLDMANIISHLLSDLPPVQCFVPQIQNLLSCSMMLLANPRYRNQSNKISVH